MQPRPTDRTALLAGLVFIVVGCVFLLERLGVIDVPASFVLPVLLVALGVGLLMGRVERPATVETSNVRPTEVVHDDAVIADVPPEIPPDPTLPRSERSDDA